MKGTNIHGQSSLPNSLWSRIREEDTRMYLKLQDVQRSMLAERSKQSGVAVKRKVESHLA